MSTVITPASETHRVCRAVCLSGQTSEAALISLGILTLQRQKSFQKPPENKICPNQSCNAQEYFHKRKKKREKSRVMKGFIALQQLDCLCVPVLSAAMRTFMTSWYICTVILQKNTTTCLESLTQAFRMIDSELLSFVRFCTLCKCFN